jgi:2-polyprenyl-6-methoxyphenol hydroxylase-like FAD-dependent oxidoreductase
MVSPNFRIIVVGGGPVGLIAAHMFARAGINFIVLERRKDVLADEGASLALWPPTFRLMDQLNLLESLKPAGNVLRAKRMYTHEGSLFAENNAFSLNERK